MGDMKREIELIMFDLDGTLAATGQDLANGVNHVRKSFGLEPLERRWVDGHVGRGVDHLLSRTLPQEFSGCVDEAMRLFLQYYERHMLDTTKLYPRVWETLDYFGNKKRAIVTNKSYHLTVELLGGLGIGELFDAIVGGDSGPRKKPDPEPLRRVLGAFAVAPERAVMVGDGAIDIEAGKGAGVYTCGVSYGLGDSAELQAAGPDLVIDDLWQLTEHFV